MVVRGGLDWPCTRLGRGTKDEEAFAGRSEHSGSFRVELRGKSPRGRLWRRRVYAEPMFGDREKVSRLRGKDRGKRKRKRD